MPMVRVQVYHIRTISICTLGVFYNFQTEYRASSHREIVPTLRLVCAIFEMIYCQSSVSSWQKRRYFQKLEPREKQIWRLKKRRRAGAAAAVWTAQASASTSFSWSTVICVHSWDTYTYRLAFCRDNYLCTWRYL